MTGKLVKPPQSRHGKGWSVVYLDDGNAWGVSGKVYIKRQSDYSSRVWWRGFRRTPRLLCEHRALKFCQEHGIPVPGILSFTDDGEVTELVLADVGPARNLDEFLSQEPREDVRRNIIIQAAGIIAKLHSLRWVHGALGNDHILVRDDGSVALIDFEKAHWSPFRIRRDLDRFWRRTALNEEAAAWFGQAYKEGLQEKK